MDRPRGRGTGRPATARAAWRGRVPDRSAARPPAGRARSDDRRGVAPPAGSAPVRGLGSGRLRSTPSSRGDIGSGRSPRASSVATSRPVRAWRCRPLMPATRLRWSSSRRRCDALGRPAADVAVLDRLGVGRRPADTWPASRPPSSRGIGRGRSGSTPCSRRRGASRRSGRCPPSATCSHSGRTPWIALELVDVEQIWRTALALT